MKNKPNNTSTEVALSTPTVNNQINMNLNQNDMIDVVIEHQLELLTKQLEENLVLISINEKKIESVKVDTRLQIIKRLDCTELKQFNKIVKQLGIEIKDQSQINTESYGDDIIKVGDYNKIDIDNVENFKDPYSYAKRHIDIKYISVYPIIDLRIKLRGEISSISINFDKNYTVSQTEKSEYNNKLKSLLKESLKLYQEKFTLSMSYLEYKYGEKRIKAKIVKASLGKSAEGRGILAMLEGATNIKLLG